MWTNDGKYTDIYMRHSASMNQSYSLRTRVKWTPLLTPRKQHLSTLSICYNSLKTLMLTHLMSRQNRTFCRQYFQVHFLVCMYLFVLWLDFTEVWLYYSNCQYVTIVLDNGQASKRRQAIAWTNVDQELRHYKASLGHNDSVHILKTRARWMSLLNPSVLKQ